MTKILDPTNTIKTIHEFIVCIDVLSLKKTEE